MSKTNNRTIDEYIKTFPADVQNILQKVRQIIKKTAPNAEEGFSYGIPAFRLNGKNLILFAGFKKHIGLYPNPHAIDVFKKELSKYKTSKGAIQLLLDEPIPYNLIIKIVKFKVDNVRK